MKPPEDRAGVFMGVAWTPETLPLLLYTANAFGRIIANLRAMGIPVHVTNDVWRVPNRGSLHPQYTADGQMYLVSCQLRGTVQVPGEQQKPDLWVDITVGGTDFKVCVEVPLEHRAFAQRLEPLCAELEREFWPDSYPAPADGNQPEVLL